MVACFQRSSRHRLYVLHWMRYSLRNINSYVSSENLKAELRDCLKSTLRRNKKHRSAWFVRSLLGDLTRFNKSLEDNDFTNLLEMVEKYKEKPRPTNTEKLTESVLTKDTNTEPNGRSINLYLSQCHKLQSLPRKIPEKYIKTLVAPLADHYSYTRILHSIENKLMKGPPKTYFSYTIAGQSRIWFIRSAVNRKHRQSKELGRLIRYARVVSQKNLDSYRAAEEVLEWAWHEANWEHFLIYNKPLEHSVEKIKKDVARTKDLDTLPSAYDWLIPVLESMKILQKSSQELQKRFREGRQRLVTDKTFDYFDELSSTIYLKRLKRFIALKEELYVTNPFTKENNLGALLKKFKLIHPNR